MKKITLVLLLLLCPFFLRARQAWPRTFSTDSMSVTIYQPQLESFSNNLLTSYSAIKIKDEKSKLSFGTIDLSARVSVNRQEDVVSLRDLKITQIKITGNSKEENLELEEKLRKILPTPTVKYTVNQFADFLTSLPDKKVVDDSLKMAPPEILFSTKEAFLVIIDGEPKFKSINSELLKLYNTPELIVLHRPSNYYYLYLNSTWYRNKKLDDNWKVASVIPKVIKDTYPKIAENDKKKLIIFTRTKPAELVQTYGEPDFGIIPSSNLMYVMNTKSDIFIEVSGGGIYLLLTGRWYYATQKEGPWKYLKPDQLPADFHSIPADSEKGHVRSSVKGTDEAKNEVAKAQIPETKRVKREKVDYKVEFDGDIQLERISTISLYYVKNASKPVFKHGTDFYSCDEAVWYHSRSADGPWELATEIPSVIYDIPASCPYYYVKYVYVYDYNPTYIYYGYLPGYVGLYSNNGVIVYGTGYRYTSWGSTYYYPYPMTYGFGIYYYDWHHHCHHGTSYHTYHHHHKDWHGPRGSLSVRYNHSDYTKYYDGHRQSWREFETRIEGPNGRLVSNRESYISERGNDLYARSERNTNFKGKNSNLDTNVKRRLDTNGRGDGVLEMERRREFDGKNRDIVSDTKRKLSVNDGKKELDVNKQIKITDKHGNTKYYDIDKKFDGSNRYNNSKSRAELKDRYRTSISQRNNVYSDKKRNIYKRDMDGWKKRQNNTWQSVNRKSNSNISNLNRQFSSRAKAQQRSRSSSSNYRSSGRSSRSIRSSGRSSGSSGRSFRRK